MSMLCALRGHAPGPHQVSNRGYTFAICRRCGADLILRNEAWQPVPKGYRIVWKAPPSAGLPADAAAGPAAAPPAPDAPLAPDAADAPDAPGAPGAAGAPGAPVDRPAGADGARKTILVADDDPLILDLLEHRLVRRGYRAVMARDGREALDRVADCRPDAIVLDAMMPAIDGFEVLRRLRDDEATAKTPVVMLTARRQEQDIVGALELGASDFIIKPFIPEELLSRLARLLARP
jgi:CheY-like chemotaxis protein